MDKKAYIISQLDIPSAFSAETLFAHFSEQPWSMLFDSAGHADEDNRFDILLHSPVKTIVTTQTTTIIADTDGNNEDVSENDPITIAQNTHRDFVENITFNDPTLAQQLPFLVGIAGAFSYDLGRHFEYLPTPFAHTLDCPDMALGVYDRSLIYDRLTQRWFECRPKDSPPFQLRDTLPEWSAFDLTEQWRANTTEQEYKNKLARIHDYLVAGDCYQVNFAQRFSARYDGSEYQAYLRLREANRAPYSVFMRLPTCCILSISPERFLSVQNNHVETKPIKGTRPRSHDPVVDQRLATELLNSEKDRAENLMIVDLLRNDISKHCQPNSVQVPSPFALESYAAVHHMVSTVVGELNPNSSPFELLRDAFPGGSITGAPKVRAMQIIDELENSPRSIYCGSMGYFGAQNDMDTSICIRTVLACNGELHCWAGGGIVLDSDPTAEYQESLDKVNKILPVLQ